MLPSAQCAASHEFQKQVGVFRSDEHDSSTYVQARLDAYVRRDRNQPEPGKATLVATRCQMRGGWPSLLVAPSSVHWEIGNALSAMFKRKAIELEDALRVLDGYAAIPIRLVDPSLQQAVQLSRDLNVYAYDAYVIACAINQRAPILSLDGVLKERARGLKLDVLEVKSL
jgi:predicted nucleic acid-binding protein